MNVIYLHSHDTGRYVQPYGYAVPTPNIQRLAEEGVLFRKAFTVAPTCSPSRACLLTGQHAHVCGQLGLANRGFDLQDPHKHLAHTLKRAGYTTALFGIQHLHRDPTLLGYDLLVETNAETGEYSAADRTDDAVAFLRNPPTQPFFMALGYAETHRVFPAVGPDDDPRYTLPPAPLPDTPATREDMAAFTTMARTLDACYGRILDTLDETGLAEDTLLICTTDHGLAFPFMKCNLTDHGSGVLLILRGPHGFSGGKVVDAMVTHLDLYPTVCALAGIDAPAWLQGQSLAPLVTGDADSLHEQIFAEVNYHAAYQPMRSVRTDRWRYIRRYGERSTSTLANIDDGPTKRMFMDAGLRDHPLDREELYDLIYDPNEAGNLALRAEYAPVLEEMRGRLNRWMFETDDPLLMGPVPAPENAVVNSFEQREPGEANARAAQLPWATRTKIDQLRRS